MENAGENVKKSTFSSIFIQFPDMDVTEKWNYVHILHAKNGKKSLKKHVKNGKSSNFQKALKSSNQLQITFWIAEKIAIDCFNPNPKYEKNS